MCTSPPGAESFNNPTVLYCFGEVVIPKVNLREDEEKEKSVGKYSEYLSEYYLQIIQLGVIVCLILFLITVLLVIKKDLVAIDRIVKKIVNSCETEGEEKHSGLRPQGRGNRTSDQCEYKDCRWDGGRNDEISFVSDVS